MPIGFHPLDIAVILAIALLIFGPKKLPELSRSIGKSIDSFKKGMTELKEGNDTKEPAITHVSSIEAPRDPATTTHNE
ncbi:MAG TPA: twin-arginine translocase TatA/TatE family subunit [Ktedonobacteraceae bacterium]|jgi:sec-independent protein translocase protein TatA|nr:twin-arginine translocase TatA/TatE family subunit [Ktedonobacteraceae bacterium]